MHKPISRDAELGILRWSYNLVFDVRIAGAGAGDEAPTRLEELEVRP